MTYKPSYADVLKNRSFTSLWLNQVLVQLSYNTLNFALLIWVFKLTNSTLAVSLLMVSIYLPSLIFGLLAGIYVDRADRRRIILIIDLLLALGFLMFIYIRHSFPLILLNTFFVNTLGQFFVPTESSSIPMLVPKKQLLLANSLFSLTLYGSFMVGFATAGPILQYKGINAIFIFGFFSLILAWMLSLGLPKIISSKNNKFANLPSVSQFHKMFALTISEGKLAISFIKGKLNVLVSIALMAAVQGIIGILAVIISSYMETVLHIHATDASYVLMIPLGLGMVVGAFLIGKFAHGIPKRYIVIPSMITAGIIFFLVGITPLLAHLFQSAELPQFVRHPRFFFRAPSLSAMFALGSFILGVAAVGIIVPAQTILQENTNEGNRGKIFSVLLVAMNSFAAIVSLLAGLLAEFLGPEVIFIILAAIILPISVMARRPAVFLKETNLPYNIRQFLGLGHWGK